MSTKQPDVSSPQSKTIFKGRVIQLTCDEFIFNGKQVMRETIHHPGAVVLVPILPDKRILFVRQYRHAVKKWLLELPAGTLEPGENPRHCARRECIEETGWNPLKLKRLSSFFSAPGFASERMHLYLADNLVECAGTPDEDECLVPQALSLIDAKRKIKTGVICDAKTIIGILLAAQEPTFRDK